MNWTRNCVIVWALLVAFSLGSYLVVGSREQLVIATLAVIVLASVKAALIMLYFMKLAFAPRTWKVLYGSWLAAVALILGVGQLAARL